MSMYIGVNNIAKEIKGMYIGGADEKAHAIQKIYIGVNNVAKLVWSNKLDNVTVTDIQNAKKTLNSNDLFTLRTMDVKAQKPSTSAHINKGLSMDYHYLGKIGDYYRYIFTISTNIYGYNQFDEGYTKSITNQLLMVDVDDKGIIKNKTNDWLITSYNKYPIDSDEDPRTIITSPNIITTLDGDNIIVGVYDVQSYIFSTITNRMVYDTSNIRKFGTLNPNGNIFAEVDHGYSGIYIWRRSGNTFRSRISYIQTPFTLYDPKITHISNGYSILQTYYNISLLHTTGESCAIVDSQPCQNPQSITLVDDSHCILNFLTGSMPIEISNEKIIMGQFKEIKGSTNAPCRIGNSYTFYFEDQENAALNSLVYFNTKTNDLEITSLNTTSLSVPTLTGKSCNTTGRYAPFMENKMIKFIPVVPDSYTYGDKAEIWLTTQVVEI